MGRNKGMRPACPEGCECGRHMIGDIHPNWTGDNATYDAKHQRLRNNRGKASEHDCVSCGEQAYEWAQVHETTGLDIYEHYQSMCRPCHSTYDGKIRNLKGVRVRGEDHGQHKLKEEEVLEIKSMLREGKLSQRIIAEKYGVHQVAISHIKLGATWSWLKDESEVIANGNA